MKATEHTSVIVDEALQIFIAVLNARDNTVVQCVRFDEVPGQRNVLYVERRKAGLRLR